MPRKTFKEKPSLHPRNKHKGQYDFKSLVTVLPQLEAYVFTNKFGTETIDFSNPEAVKILNKSLLAYYYGVKNWDIPEGYLCPPIPGRADYVHYLADILIQENAGKLPEGSSIRCLDVGTGANCIYPIIGHQEYGWSFVGTDIDPLSVKAAKAIVNFNEVFTNAIEIRLQPHKSHFFEGIIKKDERFDLTFCNPPFYASAEEAVEKNVQKNQNLTGKRHSEAVRNFGGNASELWCEGGELRFIVSMIRESVRFSENCKWFTSLVSKKEHLDRIYKEFERAKVRQFKTVEIAQGQKVSRFVAWRF